MENQNKNAQVGKSKKRKFWITTAIVIIGILFIPQISFVRATISNAHVTEVFIRFMKEIVLKYPAGQYYNNLSLKYSDELSRIYENGPDHLNHQEKLVQIMQMFTPGLEALLDGKGDTVRITKEQINILKTELDWISSVASPSLRRELEKEQQRFPLEKFIGMTMSEALDYVNSNFPPDLAAESGALITAETPQPTSTPRCIAGSGPACLTELLLASNSNGQWAYYIYNGIYFEYPSAWSIQQSINKEELFILPAQESTEGTNLNLLALMFPSNLVIENWDQVLKSHQPLWERPNTKWQQVIRLDDFQGFECLWKPPDESTSFLEFFLYNEDTRIAVGLLARIKDDNVANLINNSDAVNEIFPNIHHIAESIQVWKPYYNEPAGSNTIP